MWRREAARLTPRLSSPGITRRSRSGTQEHHAGDIGRVRVIEDFLPSPDEFAARDDTVKVTLQLSRRSVGYFKRAAKARHVPDRRMIRQLVDQNAER